MFVTEKTGLCLCLADI